MKTTIYTLLAAIVLLTACNKTKVSSKRLAGEHWKVVKLTIGGTAATELPELHFSDCDPYEEVCKGEWEKGEAHAEFAWGFTEKGKKITLSNQYSSDGHAHGGHEEEELAELSENLSGVYDVVSSGRKSMEFKCSSTVGYAGQEVVLQIEKE
ncbi:MAG: hypothetical protein LW750_09160 [Bacteroidetes bacterium]|jgi:hypothetical protein|nr:hypothetical protein [Bacteroidota bacterium]